MGAYWRPCAPGGSSGNRPKTLSHPWRAKPRRVARSTSTETNPTRVGLPYPGRRSPTALGRAPIAHYDPTPLGQPSARAAVAADYARCGVTVDPARVVLTASSSESYSFLFKLCCDPGDAVLVPEPSYPLFEYLTRLEGSSPVGYRLAFDGVWHVDFSSVTVAVTTARRDGHRPRAIIVVNPNNPTGSFLKRDELERLSATAANEHLAIISDEVFADYPFAPDPTRVTTAAADPALDARALSSVWEVCRSHAGCPSSSSAGSSPEVVTPRNRSPRWS